MEQVLSGSNVSIAHLIFEALALGSTSALGLASADADAKATESRNYGCEVRCRR